MPKRLKFTYKGRVWRAVCPFDGVTVVSARIEWCHSAAAKHCRTELHRDAAALAYRGSDV